MTLTRKRRQALIGILLCLVLVAGFATTIRNAYVAPRMNLPLHRADAVVVLGGTPYERFRYGIQLAESGLAPNVVISNSVGFDDPLMVQICETPSTVRITCFWPRPWTTRGEAEHIRELVSRNHWTNLIVVTTTAHITRARYILGRCFAGTIQMTNYPEKLGLGETVGGWIYQTGGWVRALLQRGC